MIATNIAYLRSSLVHVQVIVFMARCATLLGFVQSLDIPAVCVQQTVTLV